MVIELNLSSVKTIYGLILICVSELHAGRLARNVVLTGKVLLNGKKRRLDYGIVVSYSYVLDLTKLCFTIVLPYLIYACFFPPTS
jgi:hypothetical protein